MIKWSITRRATAILHFVTAASLVVGLAPSGLAAYSQRRAARRTPARSTTQSRKAAATTVTIYDRGYLKGYAEGFAQGQGDWGQGVSCDFKRSQAYRQRDQSYEQGLGASQEYTQGFDLGFELAYTDAYYGRGRNTATPVNALRLAEAARVADAQRAQGQRLAGDPRAQGTARGSVRVSVPDDTEMYLRLTSPINTKTNRAGDRFTATVTQPLELEGAVIEGHIATLNRSGRVSGRTELVLAFDSITLRDGRQGPLNADVEKIREDDKVKRVDTEGRIETGSRTRDSEVRGGVGAAAGTLIGGLAGGGKGALIGLLVGGGIGLGTVYVEGNNDLVLDDGAEIVIRTAGRRQL